jgi:histidinol-phosphate aminotransferase
VLALTAAEAALADETFLTKTRAVNTTGMKQLEAGLQVLGLKPIPSAGNFLLVDMGRDAMPVYDALLRRSVIVRPVGNYALPNHLRMTIGTQAQNEQLLTALTDVYGR